LHVITGLNPGGAELMLHRLVGALEGKGVSNAVCTLTGEGQVGSLLQEEGIQVYSVDMRKHPLEAVSSLRRIIGDDHPDVVHTWLYHADLLGGIAARKSPGVAVVWSLRNSRLKSKLSTRIVARLCALFSNRLPKLIVACAESAKREHVAQGYPADRIEVIPNGFDTGRYYPNPERGHAFRGELGIGEDRVVFGLVGRYDPHKDQKGFIEAISRFIETNPQSNALFLFCGWKMDGGNMEIVDFVRKKGLDGRIVLTGAQSNIEDFYQVFDVVVSSSVSEGFSNVVGEAMACGKPCIVTDVGDSKRLLNGAGIVVPPGDPGAMAQAIASMDAATPAERARLGAIGKNTIEKNYSMPLIADRYLDLYRRGVSMCAA
jgi:glycosyltransferase involved in cell wall biosynthesis